MNSKILAYLNKLFSNTGINYSFMRKNGAVSYPYFVGDYLEQAEATESGEMRVTFNLNGWTDGSWLELEKIKENLADKLRNVEAIVDNYGVAVLYSNSIPIPIEDDELKRIQIVFEVHIWRYK